MAEIVSILFTWLVFGYWGFEASKKYNRKISYKTIVFYIVLAIVFSFIFSGTKIISILGFSLTLSNILSSLAEGYAIGLIVKMRKIKHAAKY